jgi:membrane-associated phospholipid phosphatase
VLIKQNNPNQLNISCQNQTDHLNATDNKTRIKLALGSIVLLVMFAFCTAYVISKPVNNLDIGFSRILQTSSITVFLGFTNTFFNEIMLRIFCLICILYYFKKRQNRIALLFFVAAIIEVFPYAIKSIIERPRPIEPLVLKSGLTQGFSYVSSHTFEYSFFFWVLAIVLWKTRRRDTGTKVWVSFLTALSLMPILVGLGRVYVGDHWLTDIVGSCFLCGALVLSMLAFIPRYFRT